MVVESDSFSRSPMFLVIKTARVRRSGRYWVYTSGQYIPTHKPLYVFDQAIIDAVEQKRIAFEAAVAAAVRIQEEAWGIIRQAKSLHHELTEA